MKNVLLLLFLLVNISVFGQRETIERLKNELKKIETMPVSLERDTLSIKKVKLLMYHYSFVNTDSSLFYTKNLLAIAEQRNIETDIIHCFNYFGYLYGLNGNYFMAAQNYYKALGMAEKSNNEKRILDSKRNLTEAYIGLGDYSKALKFGNEALLLAKKRKDNNETLASLNNLGSIYLNQKVFDKAKKHFQEMEILALKLKDNDFISLSFYYLGKVEFELKHYPEAHQLFKDLLKYYEPKSINYAVTQIDIAEVLIAQKEYKKAIPMILEAQKVVQQQGGENYLPTSYKLLYEAYKAQGNTQEALKFHEKFMTLKDSIATESTQSRIKSLQFEYDNTLKESQLQKQNIELLEEKTQKQQIAQTRNLFLLGGILALILAGVLFWNNRRLNHKNQLIESQKTQIMLAQEQLENANQNLEYRVSQRTQELALANQELIQKNEEVKTALFTGQSIERKRVASELHDNVSSLLSAVNMSMQAISGKTLSDNDQKIYQNVREMIKNAYSEVRNISHNIMPAGLEKDGLLTTIEQLLAKINLNKQLSFSLESKGMEQRLPVQIELNVYSIVLELINNIIKHSEATKATILMINQDDIFSLQVKDNGIGLSNNDGNLGQGLGNIKSRIEALNGNFAYNLEHEKGANFDIKIPLNAD
ncbi:signal transduction histidine kinase [Arcicella aurantiaca]|uniref:Oxygen sensor histidine kinase NreB n=1 Tax=Arcicella aurantiaca TaxID=591202 RepID=A0A316DH12_9BACT|nr:sensor histidine kinase [Arcicella aurantiaca]PWK17471.1 signal transduction histidine kinase [Arcicella aurantiaca]